MQNKRNKSYSRNCLRLSICFALTMFFGALLVCVNAEEQKAIDVPQKAKPEKIEVVLEKIESLEVQNLSKDIRLLQLEAQNLLTQRQQALQQKLEELKKKYSLDGNWGINPEGTKFIKTEKMEKQP